MATFIYLNIAKVGVKGSNPFPGTARHKHNTLLVFLLSNPTEGTGPLKRGEMVINYD